MSEESHNRHIKCRFRVDREKCIAIIACIMAAPDIYVLDDESKAIIKPLKFKDIEEYTREIDGEQWVCVESDESGFNRIVESAMTCPVLAIEVDKDEGGEWVRVYPEI